MPPVNFGRQKHVNSPPPVQSGKELVLGGIKPPKAKEWDEEKTYMQRPVGEQFRPPPPKGPQTKQGAAR